MCITTNFLKCLKQHYSFTDTFVREKVLFPWARANMEAVKSFVQVMPVFGEGDESANWGHKSISGGLDIAAEAVKVLV